MITILPKLVGSIAGILNNQKTQEFYDIGELIKKSDLDWTLVRFLNTSNEPYKGKVIVGFGNLWFQNFSITREDICVLWLNKLEIKNILDLCLLLVIKFKKIE